MKIKDGFILREIAGTWIVVPVSKRVVEFNGLITLSESGMFLWKALENGVDEEALVSRLISEYDIDKSTAVIDTKEFIHSLSEKGLLA